MRSKTVAFLFAALVAPSASAATPPADGWLVWESTRADSRPEIFRARADGTEVTRMTTTGGLMPMWAPDGRWISYRDDAGTVFLVRPDGRERHQVTTGGPFVPFWLHDNSGLAVAVGDDFLLFDPETGESTVLFRRADMPAFATSGATFLWNDLTADNRYVVAGSSLYTDGYTGANGSFSPGGFSAIIVDLLHKDRVYWFGLGCWPFTPPAGDLVFHICGDCPTHPDIYRMSLSDLATRSSYAPEVAHVDSDWGHEYNPRVSNDNRWIAYMASTGCHDNAGCDYDIFLHEIGQAPTERTHVIQDPSTDLYPSMYVGPFWQPATQPRLLLTPNRLTFFASADSTPVAKTIKIKNDGSGALNPASLTIGAGAPWLNATLGTNSVTVGLNSLASLSRGTYQATITINVDGALNAPVTVPVTLIADETFPAPEAGVSEAGVGEAGTSEAGSMDGAGGTAPTPDAGVADASIAAPEKKDSGCGCNLGAPSPRPYAWALVVAGIGLRVSRRRRR